MRSVSLTFSRNQYAPIFGSGSVALFFTIRRRLCRRLYSSTQIDSCKCRHFGALGRSGPGRGTQSFGLRVSTRKSTRQGSASSGVSTPFSFQRSESALGAARPHPHRETDSGWVGVVRTTASAKASPCAAGNNFGYHSELQVCGRHFGRRASFFSLNVVHLTVDTQ
jgi:hypothetical protein